MSRAATVWLAGVVLSLAVHAALLAGLSLSVEPEEVKPQKPPEATMRMSSYEVPRVRAGEDEITGERASQDDAKGTALSQDAIPRVAALAKRPDSAPASQPPVAGEPLPEAADETSVAALAQRPASTPADQPPLTGEALPEAAGEASVAAAAKRPVSMPASQPPLTGEALPEAMAKAGIAALAKRPVSAPASQPHVAGEPLPETAAMAGAAAHAISPRSQTASDVAALTAEMAAEAKPPSGAIGVSQPAGQRIADALPRPAGLAETDASVRIGRAPLPSLKTADRVQEFSTPLGGQPAPADSLDGRVPLAAAPVAAAPAVFQVASVVRPASDETAAVAAATLSDIAEIFELPGSRPLPASRTKDTAAMMLPASFQGAPVLAGSIGDAAPVAAVARPDQAELAGLRPFAALADSRRPPSDAAAEKTAPAAPAAQRVAPSAAAAEENAASVASSLPPQRPPSHHATAALAWTGSSQERFDPASLAAIQSFMTGSDLSGSKSSAGSVRDGISALLSSVPCARLQVAFVPDTGSLELRGHVPEEGFRAPVLASLRAQVGGSIPVLDNLLILPPPQCGALSGIAAVGLPQSTDQLTNPLLVGEDAHARLYRYSKGERLIFDMTAPDYGSYVYVDYFDASGNVIHLVPNDSVTLEYHDPKSAVKIGADRADGNFLPVFIGPPYGQEIAVAFAASRPLYDGLRPTVEPADGYLRWLKDRVSRAREADPDFKGEWVYFFVSTSETLPAPTE